MPTTLDRPPGQAEPAATIVADPPERPMLPALRRGAAGRCPACGRASLFERFLRPASPCPACRQDWSPHRADDFPAYLTILLTGHLLLPVVVEANRLFAPGMAAQMILWPIVAGLLALMLIQPAKGAVIAFQWARRMDGFDEPPRR